MITFTQIRDFVSMTLSGFLAFMMPISDFMKAIAVVFLMNYVCGLLADFVEGNRWSLKKTMVFFYHCFVFSGISVFVFTIGKFMHNQDGAIQLISWLCYTVIWFYTCNVLRNLREIMIEGTTMYHVLGFLYYVMSLRMIEKIPFLSDYIKTMPKATHKKKE